MKGAGKPKGHGLPLFLAPELHMALIDFQHEKRLGRTFAGLLLLTEGLYAHGHLKEGDYQYYKAKYSQPLVDSGRQRSSLVEAECCYYCKKNRVNREAIGRFRFKATDKEYFLCLEHSEELLKTHLWEACEV